MVGKRLSKNQPKVRKWKESVVEKVLQAAGIASALRGLWSKVNLRFGKDSQGMDYS